jgi:hypothetical protein
MTDWLPTIRALLDNLLLRNGKGTSLGFLYGILFSGIVKLFNPVLQKLKIIDVEKLAMYHFIALGIIIMNLPWLTKKPSFTPQIEDALDAIKLAKENGMNEAHVQLLYKRLVEMAIDNARENQTPPPTDPLSEAVNTIGQNMNG